MSLRKKFFVNKYGKWMFMYLNYKVYMTVLIMLLKEFIYVIEFNDGYFDKIKQFKKN